MLFTTKFRKRKSAFLFIFLFTFANIFGVQIPSQSTQGELELIEWSNALPAYGNCGTMILKFYNASTKPILSAKVLFHTATDWPGGGKEEWVPFRGKQEKNSWVTYKMYLAPGKSKRFTRLLCTNVPIQIKREGWKESGRIFDAIKYSWTWAK